MSHFSPPDPLDDDPVAPEPLAVAQVICWRCDKPYDVTLPQCDTCRAANRSRTETASSPSDSVRARQSPAIVRVVWAFAAMAAVSIFGALGVALTVDLSVPIQEAAAVQLFFWMGLLEAVDTVIVMIAMVKIRTAPLGVVNSSTRALAWWSALPLLALLLAINFGYHSLLRTMLNLDPELNPLAMVNGHWSLLLLVVCIQPAIVEEIFFRQIAMGAALEMVSPAQAVLVTSVLFALAHLGQPLSLPVFALIGVALGCLRLASGSLWLPMLFHFLHNLAVLLWG